MSIYIYIGPTCGCGFFPSHYDIKVYMVCVYTYILCMRNRLQPVVASYRLTVDVI